MNSTPAVFGLLLFQTFTRPIMFNTKPMNATTTKTHMMVEKEPINDMNISTSSAFNTPSFTISIRKSSMNVGSVLAIFQKNAISAVDLTGGLGEADLDLAELGRNAARDAAAAETDRDGDDTHEGGLPERQRQGNGSEERHSGGDRDGKISSGAAVVLLRRGGRRGSSHGWLLRPRAARLPCS